MPLPRMEKKFTSVLYEAKRRSLILYTKALFSERHATVFFIFIEVSRFQRKLVPARNLFYIVARTDDSSLLF